MSAYIVFTRDKTTNQEELDVYDVKVKPTLGTFGMKPRAIYGKHKVLEGAEIEGMVIIEFPTFEEASAWYEPGVSGGSRTSLQGAEYRCVIVQGI
ncbi:DUF1330 domain-containing protein [Burkholderia sp. S171]|uniref:DUF1330 domain-containing protein n=1 Tax=Burkholderia sp. S171 TaxID=1641860 RepID=UPI00131BB7B6|nr:DUF1330 domain-containing protein [Burkholderia sp. S171]